MLIVYENRSYKAKAKARPNATRANTEYDPYAVTRAVDR